MKTRRNFITITAGGLVHLSTSPLSASEESARVDLLLHRAKERGHTDLGWLKSYHSFSFGRYHDPEKMKFRDLYVINDDRLRKSSGFPSHGHKNMEILSYVLEGELEHKDSTGVGSIIQPNQIQYMAAGKGIKHSEFNPSQLRDNHFLQIWIAPASRGLKPRYTQERIERGALDGQLGLLASDQARNGAIQINQDVKMFACRLHGRQTASHIIERGRHGWLQVAKGTLQVNGVKMHAGDALAVSKATELHMSSGKSAEFLLFDLS